MYGRGEVMLYPNAPRDVRPPFTSLSFSTTYMEKGAHSGTDGKVEVDDTDGLRPATEYDTRKTVPLVLRAHAGETLDALATLPPIERLPVIDLHHRRARGGLPSLAHHGHAFVRERVAMTDASTAERQALEHAWLRS
jgi:hypothetical protein